MLRSKDLPTISHLRASSGQVLFQTLYMCHCIGQGGVKEWKHSGKKNFFFLDGRAWWSPEPSSLSPGPWAPCLPCWMNVHNHQSLKMIESESFNPSGPRLHLEQRLWLRVIPPSPGSALLEPCLPSPHPWASPVGPSQVGLPQVPVPPARWAVTGVGSLKNDPYPKSLSRRAALWSTLGKLRALPWCEHRLVIWLQPYIIPSSPLPLHYLSGTEGESKLGGPRHTWAHYIQGKRPDVSP